MKRDPRIHLDPTTRRYHEKMAAEEAALEGSVHEDRWAAMLEPLGNLVLSRARGDRPAAVPFPPGGDERFRKAFDHIVKRLVQEDDHQREEMEVLLERHLAAYVGTRVPGDPLQWGTIASGLHDWKAWTAFVGAVPIAVIQANIAGLTRMPADQSTCIDGFGALRDNFEAALRTLDDRRRDAPDEWRWLDSVERFADEARLGSDMSLRSELLARAGASAWLAWAASFSHAVLTASAVNDVDDLDFIESLIEHCHAAAASVESRRLALLLLIRRCLELWENVDRSLTRAATKTWGIADGDRAEYEAMRNVWSTTEFPERAARVASILVASPEGLGAAVVTARHLHAPRPVPPANAPLGVRTAFRDRLLNELAQRDVDAMMRDLLAAPSFSAGVLAASLLALNAPSAERFGVVLGAYSAWLASDDFFWASPLDGHDREVVEAMASALAQIPTATAEARKLLATAQHPTQGWGFDLDAWFKAVPRIAHVLIVIAAAAAHAQSRGDAQAASELMDLAWSELDQLLRGAPMGNTDGHVASTVAYVWAYASRIFEPPHERVSVAIGRFDDVRLMISAAQNFKLNAGSLPAVAQRALREAFDARMPILERHPHVSAEALEELRKQVAELTPDERRP